MCQRQRDPVEIKKMRIEIGERDDVIAGLTAEIESLKKQIEDNKESHEKANRYADKQINRAREERDRFARMLDQRPGNVDDHAVACVLAINSVLDDEVQLGGMDPDDDLYTLADAIDSVDTRITSVIHSTSEAIADQDEDRLNSYTFDLLHDKWGHRLWPRFSSQHS